MRRLSQHVCTSDSSTLLTRSPLTGGDRLERATVPLQRRIPLTEIAFTCGFASQSHFCKAFKAAYGVTPSQYRSHERNLAVALPVAASRWRGAAGRPFQ